MRLTFELLGLDFLILCPSQINTSLSNSKYFQGLVRVLRFGLEFSSWISIFSLTNSQILKTRASLDLSSDSNSNFARLMNSPCTHMISSFKIKQKQVFYCKWKLDIYRHYSFITSIRRSLYPPEFAQVGSKKALFFFSSPAVDNDIIARLFKRILPRVKVKHAGGSSRGDEKVSFCYPVFIFDIKLMTSNHNFYSLDLGEKFIKWNFCGVYSWTSF